MSVVWVQVVANQEVRVSSSQIVLPKASEQLSRSSHTDGPPMQASQNVSQGPLFRGSASVQSMPYVTERVERP